ncbi:uncharacterized protein Z519_09833 [Cladophialophora bantiana CBS 173.52]|uniref:SAP domain-containing protein n=1 Tax=Cladophialophora bantiana (strain ATCC 10958 / CBS 173.52 / CDC B-1940 / NIH 8579) TaxID=1442370 RepID=A0A0D2FSZ0_CLAB1|nr:uncharacterized protein Z519_09833 [Cladophialophora bantiana CBS 173.52]KIW89677.1 hypothetical protein Z519_09833 [Cladophialophora bantiana CBS 173.52]
MTDWSKLKVTELKEECKSRDIPLTGLKLKQQYIDKLEEYDAQNGDRSTENEDKDDPDAETVKEQRAPQVNGDGGGGLDDDTGANDTAKDEAPKAASGEQTPGSGKNEDGADKPSAVQEKDRHSQDQIEIKEQPITEASPHTDEKETKDAPENIPENVVEKAEEKSEEDSKTVEATGESDNTVAGAETALKEEEEEEAMITDQNAESQKSAVLPTPHLTENLSDSNTSHSSQILSSDLAEEQRTRRKRSATPVPSTQDVARKRARLAEDAEESKAAEAPDQMREETEEAKDTRGEQMNGEAPKVAVDEPGEGVVTTKPLSAFQDTTPRNPKAEDQTVSMSPPRSTTSSEDRDIPPAIHPATSSIYIRNFKRPLHIPSLRAHIASIAKSRSSDDSDPINVFYLDSIRTHAFVSFASVAAASRVRSAMHGSRFPDEPLREPLFVDYVPPNKVQTWIDQETGSGFGRGGNGRRFEVVYEEGEKGVEAIFQEVDTSKPHLPPFDTSRGSRLSFDRQQSESLSAGVHADREALIPRGSHNRDRDRDRQWPPPAGPENPSSSNGTGFKALDELFDSTSTKPKLYYKPVPSSVANERSDMFRGLRLGWEEMGRSGDEGMKRYSFERSKDREEWVDKGPEFGFGRKGQARLVGVGAGRGRGGGYRGRPMDSWRGGR